MDTSLSQALQTAQSHARYVDNLKKDKIAIVQAIKANKRVLTLEALTPSTSTQGLLAADIEETLRPVVNAALLVAVDKRLEKAKEDLAASLKHVSEIEA